VIGNVSNSPALNDIRDSLSKAIVNASIWSSCEPLGNPTDSSKKSSNQVAVFFRNTLPPSIKSVIAATRDTLSTDTLYGMTAKPD